MKKSARRSFLKHGLVSLAGLGAAGTAINAPLAAARPQGSTENPEAPRNFKLGLVTYNLARNWDIDTIIKNCEICDFKGVELRTTHKHGVEPTISKAERAEVRKRFEDSAVRLVSLGTVCEFESPDPAVVEQNIEVAKTFCELAHDVGAIGIKVRPNGFPPNIPHAKTLEQIGHALSKCGGIAQSNGVEIWLEVHGRGTELPKNIRRIMEVADHPSVGICWNSNPTDVVGDSVKPSFDLIGRWLRSCHINELWKKQYPWGELFALFRSAGYSRYTFAEIPESCEPIRLMHYYRRLWEYETA
ncbi:MAG: sugar phosphate isomerase/epimerase [Acidobacteria bacterium]|nr:sugar phosphate isomerase/epimerase [Acidobacteriota bacterium]